MVRRLPSPYLTSWSLDFVDVKASVEIKDWRPKGVQKRVVLLSSSGLVPEQGHWGNSPMEGKDKYILFKCFNRVVSVPMDSPNSCPILTQTLTMSDDICSVLHFRMGCGLLSVSELQKIAKETNPAFSKLKFSG